jgi:Xaa-Pro dipeptidase
MTINELGLYRKRQERISQILQNKGLDALVINPGPSMVYLTGLHFHLSERPTIVIFTPTNAPVLILPELEAGKVLELAYPIHAVTFPEDPEKWPSAIQEGVRLAGLSQSNLGVEDRAFRFLELSILKTALPEALFHNAVDVTAQLRMIKDEIEQAHIQKAVNIAQNALEATLPLIKTGMSEMQVAAELISQLFQHGSSPELPFQPLVCSGPNGANPHSFPGERKLLPGDLLVIDWGANVDGYFSDLTRTFAVAEYTQEQEKIHKTVLQANQAAREAVKPGQSAGSVDKAARDVIENAEYGQYFIHRTGHGFGLEIHEDPYMRAGNAMKLEAGMVFTIEPGIYIPGQYGVRIEDDVVVTADGALSFSNFDREIRVVAA